MTTVWTDVSKSSTGAVEVDFLFSDGLDFLFSDGLDFVFSEGTSQIVWNQITRSTPTWSSINKN